MVALLKKIDQTVHHHILLFSLLLLLIILRIPNFFEPYWYGDEAIYLTVGTAMRHGERLYAEIIDHKTPIIYYLAMVPNQLDFRILNVATTLLTTTLFYFFVKKLIKKKVAIFLGTLFFVLLTTLPWLEGPIPNGELFVMCFVFLGATFLARTNLFQQFVTVNTQQVTNTKLVATPQLILFFIAGVFFSLGILTKVPAVFDLFGFLFIFWSLFIDSLFKKSAKQSQLISVLVSGIVCFIGVIIPILFSIVYYVARGSGQAYLNYGLLYNFHYIESFVPSFANSILNKLFTLPAKGALLALLLVGLTVTSRVFSIRFRFIAGWFCLALFASLLSNRPYPHYYLQVIPSLALMIGYVVENLLSLFQKNSFQEHRQKLAELTTSIVLGLLFLGVLNLLHVGFYATSEYYLKFYKLASHQISPTQYRDSFNSLAEDNYKAVNILNTSRDQRMFIWGTNPLLYALSGKSPTGRFTVAFHIYDFHAQDETFSDVQKRKPEYIVVMNEEKFFPQLQAYLERYYIPNSQFEHFTLWKRN